MVITVKEQKQIFPMPRQLYRSMQQFYKKNIVTVYRLHFVKSYITIVALLILRRTIRKGRLFLLWVKQPYLVFVK